MGCSMGDMGSTLEICANWAKERDAFFRFVIPAKTTIDACLTFSIRHNCRSLREFEPPKCVLAQLLWASGKMNKAKKKKQTPNCLSSSELAATLPTIHTLFWQIQFESLWLCWVPVALSASWAASLNLSSHVSLTCCTVVLPFTAFWSRPWPVSLEKHGGIRCSCADLLHFCWNWTSTVFT